MTKKQRNSSRARCASRIKFGGHNTASYVTVKAGPIPQYDAANRIAARQEEARDRHAYGAGVRQKARHARKLALKKKRRLITKLKRETKRLMRQRSAA